MTLEQFLKGKSILDKIKELEGYCNELKKFTEYVQDEKPDEIEIQIHESWVSTPYARVAKKSFIEFLNNERNEIESTVQLLNLELEKI